MLCACNIVGTQPLKQICNQGFDRAVIERSSTQGSVEVTGEADLRQIAEFLGSLTVHGQTDPGDEDPVMVFVLFSGDTVTTLLSYGDRIEIDGVTYRADKMDCVRLNALAWSILYPD